MLQIPPDYTFLVQIAIFLVLWVLLKRLWFDPALRLVRERKQRSEGALSEARAIQAEAERLRAEHAASLEQARAEAQREMQEIVRRAGVEQKRLIDAAQDDAERTLVEARAQIARDVSSARQSLRDAVHDIARMVAEKVLGRPT
jgi:F-type H+-transporting ATPase subunit b